MHATPTPMLIEPKQERTKSLRKTPSDPWLQNANEEEEAVKVTPTRRPRRPSEGSVPRMRTQRELQTENETLRNAQMDLKIRLEALQEKHNKLRDQSEEDQRRIEELEPYEAQVFELQESNSKLSIRLQEMEEDVIELREHNREVLKISEESVAQIEKKEEALQEAADIILGLEKDKSALSEEIEQLRKNPMGKTQAANGYGDPDTQDESRPSTSYHDSDYYSMPASPQDKRSQESIEFVSERAKKFIDMKKETQRSIQDLSRRLSNASMKSEKRKVEPVPQVPQIPQIYQQQAAPTGPMHTPPQRMRSTRVSLSPALAYDPYATVSSSAASTPTGGRRGQSQSSSSLETPQYRPASNRSSTVNTPQSNKSKQSLLGSDTPSAPARHSGRATQTSYVAEHIRGSTRIEPEAQLGAGSGSAWEDQSSVVSESQTTEVDANYRGPWYNQISSWGTTSRQNEPYRREGGGQRSASYTEKNFLFNPAEDESQFVEKTRSLGRRR